MRVQQVDQQASQGQHHRGTEHEDVETDQHRVAGGMNQAVHDAQCDIGSGQHQVDTAALANQCQRQCCGEENGRLFQQMLVVVGLPLHFGRQCSAQILGAREFSRMHAQARDPQPSLRALCFVSRFARAVLILSRTVGQGCSGQRSQAQGSQTAAA